MARHIDRGYAWVIMCSYFVVSAIVNGTQKSNGVLYTRFRSAFNATNAETSAVTFAQGITDAICAIIFSFLAEYFHHRTVMLVGAVFLTVGAFSSALVKSIFTLAITYGIITGCGMAMLDFPGYQIIPTYFDKKLAFAAGIGCAGSSIGALGLPFIYTAAIGAFGLSGAFFIIAAIFVQTFVPSMLMWPVKHFHKSKVKPAAPPLPSDNLENSDGRTNDAEVVPINDEIDEQGDRTFIGLLKIYRSLIRNGILWLYLFAYWVGLLASFLYLTFQQAHVQDRGITNDQTLLDMLTSAWGFAEAVARPLLSLILHFELISSWRMHQISTIILTITLVVYPFINFYWGIVVSCCVISLVWSALTICLAPTFCHIVGWRHCGPALSLYAVISLLGYGGILLAGKVRDHLGHFDAIFFTCSALSFLGFITVTVAIYIKEKTILPKCRSSRNGT